MQSVDGWRQFKLDKGKVTFRSQVQVLKQQEPAPHLVVLNRLVKEGADLCKVTEIRLGTQTVCIKDYFGIEPETLGGEDYSTHETSATGDGSFHKDRKNLVKNIAKAYRSWLLLNEVTREDCKASRAVLEDLLAKRKFNNRLVLSLASAPLKDTFEEFLLGPAEEWLRTSKINDKHAHLEAVLAYRQVCSSEDSFVRFRVLRSRGKTD